MGRPGEAAPTPKIPAGFAAASDGSARRATVKAGNGADYRLLARSVPFTGSTLILGTPLHETYVTLNQLRWIELLVTCAVIASVLLFGLWLITASLRPLRRIEETAAAIGAGDLSRRVEPDGGTTEIGRLGGALNAMLGQIEDAFAERSASEARLRRFISDASHELRTPIAAVSAYAELFDRGARDRPADLERSMTGIQRETRRMGLLVGDLLLLARLDQGRPLESRPVDLSALAADAVDAAHAMEPDPPAGTRVPGARHGHGRRRAPAPGRRQPARQRARTHAGRSRRDRARAPRGRERAARALGQGPGLDAEQAAHVFERFYRGDPLARATTAAPGLGLAIVAAIVQAHGGSVGLESMPGAGTTFRVTLPDGVPSPEGSLPARPARREREASAEERLGQRVVLARHGAQAAEGLGDRHRNDVVAAKRHHLAELAAVREVGGEQSEARREHAVVGGRRAAALEVAEDRHARLEPRHLLERPGRAPGRRRRAARARTRPARRTGSRPRPRPPRASAASPR